MLLLIMVVSVLSFIPIPQTKATTITTTKTFSTSFLDGWIYKNDADYITAWVASSGDEADWWSFVIPIGQDPTFTIYRGFLYFDTSTIPTNATITTAILGVYIAANYSVNDFDVVIQQGMPTYPSSPMVKSDYALGHYAGDGGSRNTNTITSLNYWNITMNSQGRGWIQKDGTTKLCLRSYYDIEGSEPDPPANEYISIYADDYVGSSKSAKLYVTYTWSGYRYIVRGAYYENGAVYPYIVNLTLYRTTESPLSYLLNGTDGEADTFTIDVEAKPSFFCWNTTTALNRTRIIYLSSATYEEIWIYVPNEDEPCYLYTFNVVDMVGISNAYLETIINVAGNNRVVERQSLSVVNSVPFWMIWAHRYSLRLVCDQGTYVFGDFVALTEASNTLTITQAMFPKSYPTLNMTVNAMRMNASWIEANYTDSLSLTAWVKVDIKYKQLYSSTYTTAYSVNNTGSTSQVDWYSASSTTDYMTSFTASYNGSLLHFSFPCPSPINGTNFWIGIWDAILGQLPFPAYQLIGSAIIILFLGMFTFWDTDMGLVIVFVVAGILTIMQWYTMSAPIWIFGFAMTILYILSEKKKREVYT
jgi:hypothetical protein